MDINDDDLYFMTIRTKTGVTMEMVVKGVYADLVQRKVRFGFGSSDTVGMYIENEAGEEIVIHQNDIEFMKVRER